MINSLLVLLNMPNHLAYVSSHLGIKVIRKCQDNCYLTSGYIDLKEIYIWSQLIIL